MSVTKYKLKLETEMKKIISKRFKASKTHTIMFYDFNIPYPNTSDATELARIEKILDRIHSCKVANADY